MLSGVQALCLAWIGGMAMTAWTAPDRTQLQSTPPALVKAPPYVTETLRGRVVWMGEALAERFGITSVPEARQRVLALEISPGSLVPLIEDVRGRALRVDERLRQMDLELLVRRYHGSPFVQVVRLYAIKDDGKYELDYWCDVCAIAMFEQKPCDCCQGPTELRQRKVAPQRPAGKR
jgi:hypothetical protein